MTHQPSRPEPRRRKRRAPVAAVLSAATLLAIPIAVQAAHWPQFGGDAGRSGNQPVEPADTPIEFLYTQSDGGSVRTSIVTTSGATAEEQSLAYGKHVAVPGGDDDNDIGRVHIRELLTGEEKVADAAGDVDDGDDDADVFGPGSGGVTPVEAGGKLYVIHNDTDSAAAVADDCEPFSAVTDSDNDIALAQYDVAAGTKTRDVAIGRPAGLDIPEVCTSNPQVTDGYTVETSPVITPVLADGTRRLFFTADKDTGAGARLYSVTITADGTPVATTPQVRDLPTLNTKAAPAIAYLTDPSRSTVVPYVLVALNAAEDAADILALKALDISEGQNLASPKNATGVPGNPVAISIPVTAEGALPGQDNDGTQAPAVFVSYANGDGTTTVRRFVQSEDSLSLLAQSTATTPTALPGDPAAGIATTATANADGTVEEARVAVTTGNNLYLLNSETLTPVARFVPNNDLEPGATGFSRTVPLMSGALTFVTRDDGAQLVLDEEAQRVPATDFQENPLNNNSLFAVGQPSLSRGVLQFLSNVGLFVYETGIAPPPPPPANEAPEASFTASPNPAQAGQTVSFDASASTDSDGTIATYEWDLDANGTFETNTGQTPTTTAAYSTPGTYRVALKVTDNGGKTDEATTDVVVSGPATGANQPPVASFTAAPNPARTGQTVAFDASASSDPEGQIASYQWDFDGNGSFETNTGTTAKVSRVYPDAGVFNVKLRVTDAAGASADVIKQITVTGTATSRCRPVRCRPSLSSRVRPRSDRRPPLRFTISGRLGRPSGVSRADGCQGRVAVQTKAGRKTVSNRRVQVRRDCTYRLRLTIRNTRRVRAVRSLRFAVRFQGNKLLTPRSARTRTARIR